jgi:hypothetical protein
MVGALASFLHDSALEAARPKTPVGTPVRNITPRNGTPRNGAHALPLTPTTRSPRKRRKPIKLRGSSDGRSSPDGADDDHVQMPLEGGL